MGRLHLIFVGIVLMMSSCTQSALAYHPDPLEAIYGGTGISAPCTLGYVLTGSGSGWTCSAPTAAGVNSVGVTAPIQNTGTSSDPVIACITATGSVAGCLSASDWTTFNGKQNALTIGNLTDTGTDGITVTSGTGSVIGSGTSFSQHVADPTHNGYLSSTDWSTFNGKQNSLGYTPEDVANKSTSVVTDQTSNTKYPSVKAVYDWAVGLFQTTISTSGAVSHQFVTGFTAPNTFTRAAISSGDLPSFRAGIDRYVDATFGDDTNGDGSFNRPWNTLQYACTQVAIFPAFNIIHMSGGPNEGTDASTSPIACPPYISIVSVTPYYHIDQPITINACTVGNCGFYLTNIILGSTFTWSQNDATNLSLYFQNVIVNSGLVTFKQAGSGIALSAFFDVDGVLGGGLDTIAGQVTLTDTSVFGPLTYEDSGTSYLVTSGGDLNAAFTLNGGITAWFTGALADSGFSITGATTGSGTPAIITDSGSVPPTISGPHSISLTSNSQYVAYDHTVSGLTATNVKSAIDELKTLVGGGGITSLNGLTGASQTFATGTTGTDFGISSATTVHTFNLPTASASNRGALSSADWSTFNGKQSALTIGNLTDAGTDGITVTGGSSSVIGSGTSFSQHVADPTHNGYLSSTDWTTFNTNGFNYLSSNNSVYGGTNSTLAFSGANNYVSGVGSGAAITTGTNNLAIGKSALASVVTASDNTAVGNSALNAATGGTNSAFGSSASLLNTSGVDNASFGFEALRANSTASDNSAFGSGALRSTTSAGSCAVGYQSLYNNTAAYSTAVGFQALLGNSSGLYNVAIGASALQTNSTNGHSTAIGTNALYTSTGASNTALGYNALANITTGAHNIGLGTDSGNASTTVSNRLFIGSSTASEGINTIEIDSTAADGVAFIQKMNFNNTATFTESSTPATPGASVDGFYPKSNSRFYQINSSGVESEIAINPMTTGGDIIYGGASGVETRLPNGTAGYVLQANGGTAAPTWVIPATASVTSNSSGGEKIERASVIGCGSGNCTITRQSGSWIITAAWVSTGEWTLTLASEFSDIPTCVCSVTGAFGANQTSTCSITNTSATSVNVSIYSDLASSFENVPYNIICMGPK